MKKIILSILSVLTVTLISAQHIADQGTEVSGNIYHTGGMVGIGTSTVNAMVHLYEDSETSTQTNVTQALTRAGLLITTDYTASTYTPGVFWNTQNDNSTKPKAGIYLKNTGSGSHMYFGTSNNYGTGITNDAIVIDHSGEVGIGTTAPSGALHVYRGNSTGPIHSLSVLTIEDDASAMITILTPNSNTGYYGFADADDNYVGGMQYHHSGDSLVFRVNNHAADIIVYSDGDVVIGNGSALPDSPHNDFRLAVDGKGVFKELVVLETGEWSDYVFDKDYKLEPLEDVKKFIDENNHLPNVPSAQEVKENGISLGEMDATLLRKIEELTLYLIELEEEINELKGQ